MYSLQKLGLPLTDRTRDPQNGLAFEFRSDAAQESGHVLTGHSHGIITINIAEADDAEREKRRVHLREPYRTLLGHFRHESGHYYWNRLVNGGVWLERFRATFGDERPEYAAALSQYYQHGPPADWQQRFVSAYAGFAASLGGLGRNLGTLPAHDRHAGNGGGVRTVAQARAQ